MTMTLVENFTLTLTNDKSVIVDIHVLTYTDEETDAELTHTL